MGLTQSYPRAQQVHPREQLGAGEGLDQARVRVSETAKGKPRGTIETQDNAKEIIAALNATLTKREDDIHMTMHMYEQLREKYRTARQAAKDLEDQHRTACQDAEEFEQKYRTACRDVKELEDDLGECDQSRKNYLNALWDIVHHCGKPYARRANLNIRDWTPTMVTTVVGRMFEEVTHASELEECVQMLQKELLSKSDKVQATPDEQFTQDFRAIVSSVKTLSRTTEVDISADPVTAPGSEFLLKDVSHHHWSDRRKRKLLVEAWVWSVLIKTVFGSPFAIFGGLCEQLNQSWHDLFFDEHILQWPEPSALCETWRCTTIERITSLVDGVVITKGETTGENSKIESSINEFREGVKYMILEGFAGMSGIPDPAQVQLIIDKSFALAMQMSLQPYRLQVTFPGVGDIFSKETMASIDQDDEDGVSKGKLAFVVNPGLTKWGDTHAQHFDHRYDIVPALVQLEPVIAKEDLDKMFPDQAQQDGESLI